MGLTLPGAATPAGSYVPAVQSGNLVFISGQLPKVDGKLTAAGPVPSQVSVEQAQAAAKICALNALAALDLHLGGDWSRFVRVVKLTGFVRSDADFADQPMVINGASDFLGELFGDAGQHARAAVGVNALPAGTAVEVEFIIEVK